MQVCIHTGDPLHLRSITGDNYAWSKEGVLYSLNAAPLSYEADYFFSEYEKSYGKSYTADEHNLRRMARGRLEWLEKAMARTSPSTTSATERSAVQQASVTEEPRLRVLEIGCAAGYFLDEARLRGYDPTGIEISHWASEQARSVHRLKVFNTSFLDFTPDDRAETDSSIGSAFDVVAAFYVIEHFADQQAVFRKISALLKPGGFLLCALPSTNGPLLRCTPSRWMETHPADHYVDYSPDSLERILPLYGMKAVQFRPASYHQERTCGLLKLLPSQAYRILANLTAFGDTLEFLAQKQVH